MNLQRCLLRALVMLVWTGAWSAQAKLNVVATLPDFGAVAEAVGGERVKVTSLARGTEDPHFVDARPSFIRVLNQADVLLEGGADLEAGWLPPLVAGARNARILADAPGRVNMSRGIPLLDVPTGPIDRSMGDVHPGGNPHYTLDPVNGQFMAAQLAEVFSRLDPSGAATYQSNLHQFHQRVEQKLAEWTRRLEPFRGTRVVTYHKTYDYLARRFGLEIVGQLEPKPGIEPSPTHLNALIPQAKAAGVRLILIEPNRGHKTPDYVARSVGAKVVVLPALVGGHEKVRDYIGLFDYDVAQLSAALKEPK